MLVSVDFKETNIKLFMQAFKCTKEEAIQIGKNRIPEEIETGIYIDNSFNFEHKVETDIESIFAWTCYGVCDNFEQIKVKYKDLIESEEKYVIALDEVIGKEQPEDGGWRWHKWGQYIGCHEPEFEYLYDEKYIDKVFVFEIYKVNL
jgi:hypothetical protein